MTPHKCPICEGRGQVPSSFYDGMSTNAANTTCRSCYGTGIVWDNTQFPHYPIPTIPLDGPLNPPWPIIPPNDPFDPYPTIIFNDVDPTPGLNAGV